MSNELPDSHDPLRDLIHQSLVSDKLTPSAELRTELEDRLAQRLASPESSDEVVVTPAKSQPEKKPRRRIVRPWHMALVVTAVLAVMIYLSLPERWRRTVAASGETASPQSQVASADGTSPEIGDDVYGVPVNDAPNGLAELPEYLLGNVAERNEQLVEGVARETALTGEKAEAEARWDTHGPSSLASNAPLRQQAGIIAGDHYPALPPAGESQTVPGRYGAENETSWAALTKQRSKYRSEDTDVTVDGKGRSVNDPTDSKVVGPRIIIQEEEEDSLGLATFELMEQRSAKFLPGSRPQREQLARSESERLLKLTTRLELMQVELGPKHPDALKLKEEINHVAHYIEALRKVDERIESPGTEQYDAIRDNPFLPAKDAPLSTFSIDVDTASYANVRRFLTQGQLPPANAVRIEELLNYFSYDYPAPKGDEPFSVNMETAPCPWQADHLLLRVGLKGKEVHKQERPASNLVFLIDTSGSMSDEDKLPLVKQAMSMLTGELGERDRITIVTYAGEAGLKLAPTNGGDHGTITSVINSLNSNGSTHGSAGIQLAYAKARESFIKEGTNRVILCTDGDLNVGITQDDQLVDLISREAKTGVFLTVLGFGQGNLKDSKMEKLADHGNGVYAYIDGVREAKKVLVDQLSGSLTTIAKDVKIQIEFNPAQVSSYRLIGYENRILAAKDFNDDTKDAGEIGAGHTVTALYELIPAGAAVPKPVLDELKYQKSEVRGQKEEAGEQGSGGEGEKEVSKELLTLKLRFKQPDGDVSKKLEYPLSEKGARFNTASADFRFAASVAAFGMILRDSPHRGGITMAGAGEIAASSLGEDTRGYRAEFLDLVRRAEKLGKR